MSLLHPSGAVKCKEGPGVSPLVRAWLCTASPMYDTALTVLITPASCTLCNSSSWMRWFSPCGGHKGRGGGGMGEGCGAGAWLQAQRLAEGGGGEGVLRVVRARIRRLSTLCSVMIASSFACDRRHRRGREHVRRAQRWRGCRAQRGAGGVRLREGPFPPECAASHADTPLATGKPPRTAACPRPQPSTCRALALACDQEEARRLTGVSGSCQVPGDAKSLAGMWGKQGPGSALDCPDERLIPLREQPLCCRERAARVAALGALRWGFWEERAAAGVRSSAALPSPGPSEKRQQSLQDGAISLHAIGDAPISWYRCTVMSMVVASSWICFRMSILSFSLSLICEAQGTLSSPELSKRGWQLPRTTRLANEPVCGVVPAGAARQVRSESSYASAGTSGRPPVAASGVAVCSSRLVPPPTSAREPARQLLAMASRSCEAKRLYLALILANPLAPLLATLYYQ